MLEKVKVKAKEFLNRDDVQIIGNLVFIVAGTGLITYGLGYFRGISAGIDETSKAMVNVFDELAKIAEKAA